MYEIREWKMDHLKLLCYHVPKQHTCYSRILKSHPSSDCNFRYDFHFD
ncbi:ATP-binding cassette sub-family A member 13 [Gossypium arboreum]|uniref:ATP-binding cassette sub-family A member 13 n=1 Tax=Gossypium arboreum TaxID=29729 RepID=A0A0B0MPZ5_GOSAR|nr:ATP-binding cassette sub-family A member 13 [Gossypium arboreum]